MSIEDVARLRNEGWAWEKIAAQYGMTRHQLRLSFVPGYAEKCKQRYLDKLKGHRSPLSHVHHIEQHVYIPPCVLEEREHRAALEPRDNTAALLNDPLPGYSALDRREAHAQRTSQAIFQPLPATRPAPQQFFAGDALIALRRQRCALKRRQDQASISPPNTDALSSIPPASEPQIFTLADALAFSVGDISGYQGATLGTRKLVINDIVA